MYSIMLLTYQVGGEFDLWVLNIAADLLSLKQLSVEFLPVDRLPPAAQSLQFTEQSGQPTVLQAQLVDFFSLTKQVGHTGMFNTVMSWNFKLVLNMFQGEKIDSVDT